MQKLSVALVVIAIAANISVPVLIKAKTVTASVVTSPIKVKPTPVTPVQTSTPKPSGAPVTSPVKN